MLNNKEFVDAFAEKTGKTKKESAEIVEAFLETVKEVIVKDGGVKFTGFGQFEVKERAARECRNPQTGEPVSVPETKTLKFKASSLMKEAVKGE